MAFILPRYLLEISTTYDRPLRPCLTSARLFSATNGNARHMSGAAHR